MFTQYKKTKYLMYHAFSETQFNRYCMNIDQFRNQNINKDYIVTFDDGSESLFRYSDVILSKGETQIVFIRTDKIGSNNYLSWSQIQSLSNNLIIQSHSHSHYDHLLLNDDEIRQEGLVSKEKIEDITGRPVNNYAFPGGYWSTRCIKILSEIGYRSFFSSIPLFFCKNFNYNGITLYLHGRVEIYSPGYSTIKDYCSPSVTSRRLLRHILSYSNYYVKSKLI